MERLGLIAKALNLETPYSGVSSLLYPVLPRELRENIPKQATTLYSDAIFIRHIN
jgi:hypothetical protein